MKRIPTSDVLRLLGFAEQWEHIIADELPGYCLVLGDIGIQASQMPSVDSDEPVMWFTCGCLQDQDYVQIEFELPIAVSCIEQGVAMIVHEIGADFQPENPPLWIKLGRKWREHLPQTIGDVEPRQRDLFADRSASSSGPANIRDVLALLGFAEDWNAMTDEQPGYQLNLGNIEVTANQVLSSSAFKPVILLAGFAQDKRTLKQIRFDIPLQVHSIEQGIALIVHAIGPEYEAEVSAPWFGLGLKWQDRLPWFEEANR